MHGLAMRPIRDRLEGRKPFDKTEWYEKDVRALFTALESVQLLSESLVNAIDNSGMQIEQNLMKRVRDVAKGKEF